MRLVFLVCSILSPVLSLNIPGSTPSGAAKVDPALVSVSLEFFAFPGYTELPATANCLANLAAFRGAQPAVRIGGTTQDRATYDPALSTAVNYTVAAPGDAPASLTYGPSFFTLAGALRGDVTVGLNRQLDNQANTLAAGVQAKNTMSNLLAIELGNEPEYYAAGSPIAQGAAWNAAADGASQKSWFTNLASSLGDVFEAAVYLQWDVGGLVPLLGDALSHVKSFSRHSYPNQAAEMLMAHSSVVSYVAGYKSEIATVHNAGKLYFFGETNSATGGGATVSPTYAAALWIVDYVLQAALNGADRLYFHHGTIGNCQYCWWGASAVYTPYYGAAFVSEFLGTDGAALVMLDDGTGAVGSYVVYDGAGAPVRLLRHGTRASTEVSFSGLGAGSGTLSAKRLTGTGAGARVDEGDAVTIGGGGFDDACSQSGTQVLESVAVSAGTFSVELLASEALIVYLE
ncbi:glycoside hydrolase family 79 protein [Plicaturopsis crispa FD-325 SS-3]|nr:glycoside hydrolase family 79 protein [Plicaturopsis crispa FD-325 SS-3]